MDQRAAERCSIDACDICRWGRDILHAGGDRRARTAALHSRLAIGPKGELYVCYFQALGTATGSVVIKSVDGGQTFSAPVLVAQPLPGTFGSLYNLGPIDMHSTIADVAVNPVNGEVYVVYAGKPPVVGEASDVYLTRSTDGGRTWSSPLRINDDSTTTDQFFPSVAVNAKGVVQALWYDRRRDPNNFRIGVFSATSTNGGRSFNPNFAVTEDNSLPITTFDPASAGFSIGYSIDIQANLASSGVGSDFLLAWTGFQRKMISDVGLRQDQDIYFTRNRSGQ
jgi:hypothetical protein